MNTIQFKQTIRRELPIIMRDDPEIRQFILNLVRKQFADKRETESRFDRVLGELRRDREANERKWRESARKWDENQAALRQMQDESARKWDENQSVIDRMLKKYDTDIGALGARWGIRTEQSFRNALASILEESFAIKVLNINEFDDEGQVFGYPEQIEIDIIIKNGLLIICEIKSSMGRSKMYTFGRKISFYENRHQTKANRKLVISPWVTKRAKGIAKKLDIEVYTHADEIEEL